MDDTTPIIDTDVSYYQLRRFSLPSTPSPLSPPSYSSINVHLIEAHPKSLQDTFGRAVTFWPRSMELLSAMGLGHEIEQQCYAVRSSAAFDREGRERTKDGAWGFIEGISDTRYTFASVLRQKYVEEILRRKGEEVGVEVNAPCAFEGLVVDDWVEAGEVGRVVATIRDGRGGGDRMYKVRCRYIIGCDGSRTKVRGAAGIDSEGSRTEDKWVRVDGVLESTTMPKPRSYGAIESPLYGNVLWIPLDHGATRLGYKFDPGLTEREIFIKESELCVQPFKLKWAQVDWGSVYSVGQRVAKTFFAHDAVFLAGDSCHTHSSGAGQGMNAGVNDAANLAWKLALVLTGRAKRRLLDTYNAERQVLAEKLIRYDEGISELVSGRIPKGKQWEKWQGEEDPNVVLGRVLMEAKGFNTGLTLGYQKNPAVWEDEKDTSGEEVLIPAPARPGLRAPDVRVLLPALWESAWLLKLMPNQAHFHILTFVGRGLTAKDMLRSFKEEVEAAIRPTHKAGVDGVNGHINGASHGNSLAPSNNNLPVQFLTILPERVDNGWHELGFDPLGKVYYDQAGAAGERYEIDVEHGTTFIIRPDMWIGARFDLLEQDAGKLISQYLRGLLVC
ncbi:Phenol 2-monooxygenase [Cyphellophora attinorum]|uniref:Phenol 2-monooxygenase n=1 Tax=Cyphellophora attinorum TaxID=1664694 RepID=A0A0N0NNW1_9EURO|nr:Phenol 2-monooxygenase [Phialophora attinorum]KPI41839.1 Phenol 2-monooxygenase [Phialophora attinorum]